MPLIWHDRLLSLALMLKPLAWGNSLVTLEQSRSIFAALEGYRSQVQAQLDDVA
jgi:hypothetical protein